MKSLSRYIAPAFLPASLQRIAGWRAFSGSASCVGMLAFAALLLAAPAPAPALAASKAQASAAANTAALRVSCEDADANAEVYVNEKFKGECPVDIMLPEGTYKVRVVKKIDASHERSFEQELRLAENTAKKIAVTLGLSRLSPEGRKLAEKETKDRRGAMENDLRKLISSAKAGDADAKALLTRSYIADTNGCLAWNANPKDNEAITWTGPCRDGMVSGKGEFQWFKNGVKGNRYSGEMIAGKRDGQGAEYDQDGYCEGDWVAGYKTGYAKCVYLDGGRSEGNWLNNRREGYGVYSWANNIRYEGNYVAGKRTGRGVVIFADGSREEGQYLNDVFKGP